MTKTPARTFPILDRLGGKEAVAQAMMDAGFSSSPHRLIRGYLDRQAISAEAMRFMMALADEQNVAFGHEDFLFCAGETDTQDAAA